MITEDNEAWLAYPHCRWLFDKLALSLKLGYRAGPAGVAIDQDGCYVIRPCYNLLGMGLGAKKVYLTLNHNRSIINGLIAPGYFWCEWYDGPHLSLDFVRQGDIWKPFSAVRGYHHSQNNLSKFSCWEVVNIPNFKLPQWVHDLKEVEHLNIEFIGENIVEVHLRYGNQLQHNSPLNSKLYPVWKGDNTKYKNFIPNPYGDLGKYEANGLQNDVRIGFTTDDL
tara:strand:+ start:237 stop:905 length:669 start_codon:yes stop_codon:yes gene_type:complete